MLGAQQARRNSVGAQQERWHGAGQQAGACVDGRAGRAHAAGERQAHGVRGARQGAAVGAGASGARGLGVAGRWACGLGARAGQDCALGALNFIFKPVFRLSIFPESLNEQCSL